jgi:hypothetical protein
MKHVIMLSGGASSYLAAKRVFQQQSWQDIIMLFADTLTEDEDLYRFLGDIERHLGPITRLADGRTVWQVFRDVRFLGNSRIDPCSRILKRELLRRWLAQHCQPDETVVYLGFDWDEAHRMERARPHWAPWTVRAPMTEPPYLSRAAVMDELRADGIAPPRLYAMGFHHNNCGGFCVKAGQAQFAQLLRQLPDRYAEHEQREQELRAYLGADVAILKHRSGPKKGRAMTLREFRERLEAQGEHDQLDWGACSCFDVEST